MGSVIASVLTDASMRSASTVESALISKARVAGPWGN
jgi:hypothetical protein